MRLPMSEQGISNARIFAFILVFPQALTERPNGTEGRHPTHHFNIKRSTQSKTKSALGQKALCLYDADFASEFGWPDPGIFAPRAVELQPSISSSQSGTTRAPPRTVEALA